jgi:hypothetical protein
MRGEWALTSRTWRLPSCVEKRDPLEHIKREFSCDPTPARARFAVVTDTIRGVVVFVTALVTIAIWAPLRNHPERLPDGVIVTETYFGVFTYLTLRTELKEPEYRLSWTPNYGRLALTAGVTTGLWGAVVTNVKKRRNRETSGAHRPEP